MSRLRDFLKSSRVLAWRWNDEQRARGRSSPDDVRPGMTVMLPASAGGYDPALGWTGNASDRLPDVPPPGLGLGAYDDDSRSMTEGHWVALPVHLADARREAEALVGALGDPLHGELGRAVIVAAGEHDVGKAHSLWRGPMRAPPGPSTGELWAKFPPEIRIDLRDASAAPSILAWLATRDLAPSLLAQEDRSLFVAVARRPSRADRVALAALPAVRHATVQRLRSGMRHEAATALEMWHRYRTDGAPFPVLAIYLAVAHHGKVRTHLRAKTPSGTDVCGVPRASAPLPWAGGRRLDFSCSADGAGGEFLDDGFRLDAPGWTGLVSDLLGPSRPETPWDTGSVPETEPRKLGPFRLAYLEALVRVADWRASAQPSEARHVRS